MKNWNLQKTRYSKSASVSCGQFFHQFTILPAQSAREENHIHYYLAKFWWKFIMQNFHFEFYYTLVMRKFQKGMNLNFTLKGRGRGRYFAKRAWFCHWHFLGTPGQNFWILVGKYEFLRTTREPLNDDLWIVTISKVIKNKISLRLIFLKFLKFFKISIFEILLTITRFRHVSFYFKIAFITLNAGLVWLKWLKQSSNMATIR